MKPKSLIKNIPAPNQQWKAPVKVWVRDLYEEKFGKVINSNRKTISPQKEKQFEKTNDILDEDLPF